MPHRSTLPGGRHVAVALITLACCAGPQKPAAPAPAPASDDVNPIRTLEPGLHAMDFAGSTAKATIVEFDRFVALIEVPIRDAGGGAPLLDDVAGGERVVRSLARRFPTKPLTHVLSSHAHPHSLSAWRAFVDRGIILVTTRANHARLETMLDDASRARAASLVRFVDDVPVRIEDPGNVIVAQRFRKADYPSVPTEDYLYFELPKYAVVHTSCMFDRWDGPPIGGRELLTRREEDLFKVLTTGRAPPGRLLRVDREPTSELLPFDALAHVVATGVRAKDLGDRYRGLTATALRRDRIQLLQDAARDQLPAQILNGLVYEAVQQRRLDRAFELAVLQALLVPETANAWDTLGEICYFRGAFELARRYEQSAKRIDPKLEGGEAVWKVNVERQTTAWTTNGIAEARDD